jgi:hypothetical protein
VWWLLSVSLAQFVIHDLPKIVFKGAFNDLNFRVALEGRKGAMQAILKNWKKIENNFKEVNTFFSGNTNSDFSSNGKTEDLNVI